MSTPVTEVENQGVIEIRDPELDVADIMRRIRQNMAIREKLPPLAAALGQARLFEERRKLCKTIEEFHARVNNYGTVDTRRTGWRGKAELLVKKCIRKLIGRYLAQQQEVHGKLVEAIYQLADYLDQQEEVLRQRFDQCDLRMHDTALTPTPTLTLTPTPSPTRSPIGGETGSEVAGVRGREGEAA
jgi:hypothetical protein